MSPPFSQFSQDNTRLSPDDQAAVTEHPEIIVPAAAQSPTQTIHPTESNYQPASPQPSAPQTQPQSPYQQPVGQPSLSVAPSQQPYDFIVNPAVSSGRPSLLGGSSMGARIALIAGGLLALLIVFVVLRGIFSGGSSLTPFVSIAQEQQALIHLVNNATQRQDLTVTNRNFAMTTKLSLTTSKADVIAYLKANGESVNDKTLSLKISTATDEQLTAAGAATTYNQTFKGIMQNGLTSYVNNLKSTFDQTQGEKGRNLLSKNFDEAQLLLEQLNAPAN